MAKTREQKKQIVKDLEDKLKKSKIILFASFGQHKKKGLSVKLTQDFKKKLKPNEAEFSVTKKNLIEKAMDNLSLLGKENIENIEGSLGVVFGYGDIISPARELYSLSKNLDGLVINFGLTSEDGYKLLDSEKVVSLARLPSREVLLAQLAGGLKSPVYLLKNVLEANIRNLMLILGNIKN